MVKKLTPENIEDLIKTMSALSNPKRVRILAFISKNPGKKLIEIHEGTKDGTGISHRETTYNYLTPLVEADLVEKNEERGNITYSLKHRKVVIEV